MKIFIGACTIAAACMSSAAYAEAFSGVYAGGIVGYDKLSAKVSSGGVSASESGDAITGGALVGYNAKVGGNFVIGAEIEGVIGGGKIGDGVDDVKTDYSLATGVRGGFLVAERALIFAKVAYVNTRLSFDGEGENGDGFAFGGGVEVAFSDKISGRVTYMRSSYSIDEDAEAALGADVDINRDQVLGGIVIHF
ncbi:MAG: outer membrane protein [Sphingomonadaceae bacterium]